MTQEDKELLLKDLCARLLYGVKALTPWKKDGPGLVTLIDITSSRQVRVFEDWYGIEEIKPYLRPMSSMTKEEREEIEIFICDEWFIDDDKTTKVDSEGFIEFLSDYDCSGIYPEFCGQYVDWLLSHHFDFRGLIEKSLAIVAPDDMYK